MSYYLIPRHTLHRVLHAHEADKDTRKRLGFLAVPVSSRESLVDLIQREGAEFEQDLIDSIREIKGTTTSSL